MLCPWCLVMRQTLKYLRCLCWGIEVPCWRHVLSLSAVHSCRTEEGRWMGINVVSGPYCIGDKVLMLLRRHMFWSSSVAFIQSMCYLTEKHDFSQTWFQSAPLFHQIRELMVGRYYWRSLVQPHAWSKTIANTGSGQLGFCPDKSWRKIFKTRGATTSSPDKLFHGCIMFLP